ncbi:MAG: SH3 beta-barrel fold-containing protein [Bacteroidales bacterium]|nr:SH3 beta-barrel fold-containing protein [Bacteroidales bacterium]
MIYTFLSSVFITLFLIVGTLDMTRIPEKDHPKGDMSDGHARKPNTNTFCYYDLIADGDCGGWKSFRLENFIGFVTQV